MLLSEAIREAARRWPQAFGGARDGDARCANEGAREVAGAVTMTWGWPELCKGKVCCPERCGMSDEPAFMVVHLNDDHRWSRERIADWVAEQETRLGITEES